MDFNGLKWDSIVSKQNFDFPGMAMMHYTDVSQDYSYYDTTRGALVNASFGTNTASFLGPPGLENFSETSGKWNDDILWWALACIL